MQRVWKPLFGVDRFGTLLFFLIAVFLLSGASDSGWPRVVGAVASVAMLLAAFAATDLMSHRVWMGVLIALAAGSAVLVSFDTSSPAGALGAFGQALVLGVILIAVVRRVLGHEHVGLPTIVGAIAAYVLIGLVFAWVYLGMFGVFDGPVLDPDPDQLPAYYSFEVLTTLGFGDITPVNEIAKRVTAIEAITGQVFLATLVARLVSMYGTSARRE